MDAASGSENSFPHPHALPERRQQRSKVNRKKPYDQKKKGTGRSKASSSTPPDVSSDSDLEEEDYFRPHQAIVCPFPVGDQRCGALVNSAKAMFKHLTVHGVDHRKSENVNSHLGGRCPLKDICNGRMKGGSIHRHLMEHFFHLKCPELGCRSTYSRCYELKRHCREEHNFGLTGKDDDYVVRKNCWD
ncbi:hypothetical protein M413DRAFT_449911 [Hebeloma cylindrosporum]|uniref:C2H2-type domain-containing protein n=1 Tax=Hebeloma cylindrosporum TaxID=76867 RepID=A0A0C2XAQ8_HEBCY|nr:hypothetical protein M413DRAFT_449911 [Hebeloma cylindrosporum h7]